MKPDNNNFKTIIIWTLMEFIKILVAVEKKKKVSKTENV